MTTEQESLKQAAILLLNMGEEQAAKVLKHLDPKQVEKLISYMNKLDKVKEHDVVHALNHFFIESTKESGLSLSSADYIRTSLTHAVGTENATSILDNAALNESSKGFKTLKWQTSLTIAELLQDEHPQVIAIAMTYLDSEKAAATIKLLPKHVRVSVLKKISHIGPISPIALEELSKVLEEQLSQTEYFRTLKIGGIDTTANIVNMLDSELENEVLNSISESDENLATQIQDRMFPFEKLAELDGKSLQTLLREISNEELAIALKGADPELQNAFLKNISARAAEMLKDDLEVMGPVQLTKIIDTQKKIVNAARKLSEEGKIMLGGKSSGDMVF